MGPPVGNKLNLIGAAVLAVTMGGCTMPMPVTIASYAMDGVSYLASGKSITDHGISIVMQRDCALLRGLTEGQVCYDDAAVSTIAVASNQDDRPVDLPDAMALAAFPTAAGTGVSGAGAENPFDNLVLTTFATP